MDLRFMYLSRSLYILRGPTCEEQGRLRPGTEPEEACSRLLRKTPSPLLASQKQGGDR